MFRYKALPLLLAAALLTGCMSAIYAPDPGLYDGGAGAPFLSAVPAPPVATAAATPLPTPLPTPIPTPLPVIDVRLLLISDTPAGLEDVLSAVNARLESEARARLMLDVVGWAGWKAAYDERVTRQAFDLCYVSSWAQYEEYALYGAFMSIDDRLAAAAPLLFQTAGEAALNAARVGGELYAVPRADMPAGGRGVLFRDDIREELGLPPPDSVEALERYLIAVKERGGIAPYMASALADAPLMLLSGSNGWAGVDAGALVFTHIGGDGVLFDAAYTPQFRDYINTMARWQEMGLIKPPSRSGRSLARYAYEMGESAICIAPMSEITAIAAQLDVGAEGQARSAYMHESALSGAAYAGAFTEGVALAARCAQPERVLSVLEALLTDAALYDLTHYGIEGTHYTLTSGGAVVRDAERPFGLAAGFLNVGAAARPLAGLEWLTGARAAVKARLTPFASAPHLPGDEMARQLGETDARFTALFYGKGDIEQALAELIEAHDALGTRRL